MGINEIVLLLVTIALGVASFALAIYVWDERVMILAIGRAIFQRYFTISIDVGRLADVRNDYVENDDDERSAVYDTGSDSNQVEPRGITTVDTSMVPDTAAGIRIVAAIQLTDGTYLMSANKIADGVKINRNEALDIIREVRGSEPKPAAKPDLRFPESTKDGRLVSAALKGK